MSIQAASLVLDQSKIAKKAAKVPRNKRQMMYIICPESINLLKISYDIINQADRLSFII
jgi:hypothetical protein